ncbi:MAG: hypothetical protein GXP51_00470 [Deltaproteobacteria bacterium]|nr:hypothetical protein [Deltaproteobacteria bacterium]
MFEVFLLLSVMLIVIGQLLPEEGSQFQDELPAGQSIKTESRRKFSRNDKHRYVRRNKKQPHRKSTGRAVS